MLDRILVHVIQPSEIGLFIGQARFSEVMPDLPTRCVIKTVEPFGGLLV
jgi:hypothetical protein